MLFDCLDSYIPNTRAAELVNYVTTAALEESLHCAARRDAFDQLVERFSEVTEFLQER